MIQDNIIQLRAFHPAAQNPLDEISSIDDFANLTKSEILRTIELGFLSGDKGRTLRVVSDLFDNLMEAGDQ